MQLLEFYFWNYSNALGATDDPLKLSVYHNAPATILYRSRLGFELSTIRDNLNRRVDKESQF